MRMITNIIDNSSRYVLILIILEVLYETLLIYLMMVLRTVLILIILEVLYEKI